MAPILIATIVLFVLHGGAPTLELSRVRLLWPTSKLATDPSVAGIVYPAVALAAVMTFVLRWRGGPWLWAWALVPVVIVDARGPWVPHSVLLVVIAVAASGWVWLAGLWPPHHARLARGLAGLTALGLCVLSWLSATSPSGLATATMRGATVSAVAEQRPLRSLVSVYTRGLIAPGDVLVAHNRWLAEALEDRSRVEGWRPDVAIVHAESLNDQTIARLSLDWQRTGRRILSDSYNLGGHWRATWAVDSGPLFWFVGEHALSEPDFTDLSDLLPPPGSRDPERMRQWHRLAIERTRFRRALRDPSAALAALPLPTPRFRSLLTRLQLVRSARTDQAAGSELPATLPSPAQTDALDAALVSAEAGDLLFSYGEQERATELLIAAANDGYRPAWGALARWQLRAGSTSAATATLAAIASTAALRSQALAVLRWLLSRGRIADARELLTVLGPPRPGALSPPDTANEVAARLRLLDAMAVHPPGFPGTRPQLR
ncbi:MAG: hypothetical protein JKY37_01935 [Nannocystaceae bacterium]|nr:hypothetical protein [Nannocystaceae bacterium]